jgi:division protein CdvB (Snf7/Vps24/ESCRT-III family)
LDNLKIRQTILVSQESLNELKQLSLQFEQSNTKLQERDKVLYDMIGKALRKKDTLRANMFANELTRVRHLKRVFSQSQLVLECISIRMENLLELYNAIQMEPISQVIKEVIGDVQGVSPEFMSGLEQLTKLAGDTLKQTTIGFQQPVLDEIFSAKSPESIEILKEVSNEIESCLQESFPEPPITEASTIVEKPAEAIAYGYEATFTPRKTTVADAPNNLNMLSEDVVKMLDSFNAKDRLKREEETAT